MYAFSGEGSVGLPGSLPGGLPRRLALDIETFSCADLSRSGVYRYAEDPGLSVLLMFHAT